MAKDSPMIDCYSLSVELTFTGGLKVSGDTLVDTVADAIFHHDSKNRLLPGVGKPLGGERLIGTSIAIERHERKLDPIGVSDDWTLPPMWKHSEAERSEMVRVSGEIDKRIEDLQEVQARLWTTYHAMLDAASEADLKPITRRARRQIKAAKARIALD